MVLENDAIEYIYFINFVVWGRTWANLVVCNMFLFGAFVNYWHGVKGLLMQYPVYVSLLLHHQFLLQTLHLSSVIRGYHCGSSTGAWAFSQLIPSFNGSLSGTIKSLDPAHQFPKWFGSIKTRNYTNKTNLPKQQDPSPQLWNPLVKNFCVSILQHANYGLEIHLLKEVFPQNQPHYWQSPNTGGCVVCRVGYPYLSYEEKMLLKRFQIQTSYSFQGQYIHFELCLWTFVGPQNVWL